MTIQKKLIYSLVLLSVLLLLANIVFEISAHVEAEPISEMSIKEIEKKVSLTLNDYGIKSEWIKKVHVKNNLSDSLNYLYNVTLPKDVSIPSLIKDLNSSFTSDIVNIETVEKINYSNTLVDIYSNKKLKLHASLKHSKKNVRIYSIYSFLVLVNFDDVENELNELENIYCNFTYLVVPSKSALNKKKIMNGNYALLLNDELSGSAYALEEDYSKQKLINRIHSIIISFGRDKTYLIDKSSNIYNSKIYSLLRDEFNKRGINIIPLQKYSILKGETTHELVSLFDFYSTSLKGKEGKTFVVNLKNFLDLQTSIAKQVKMGDKVMHVKF
jgi:hypothetical protein